MDAESYISRSSLSRRVDETGLLDGEGMENASVEKDEEKKSVIEHGKRRWRETIATIPSNIVYSAFLSAK